jgi:hypothetical protein
MRTLVAVGAVSRNWLIIRTAAGTVAVRRRV